MEQNNWSLLRRLKIVIVRHNSGRLAIFLVHRHFAVFSQIDKAYLEIGHVRTLIFTVLVVVVVETSGHTHWEHSRWLRTLRTYTHWDTLLPLPPPQYVVRYDPPGQCNCNVRYHPPPTSAIFFSITIYRIINEHFPSLRVYSRAPDPVKLRTFRRYKYITAVAKPLDTVAIIVLIKRGSRVHESILGKGGYVMKNIWFNSQILRIHQ